MNSETENLLNAQLMRFSALLQLEQRIRKASAKELEFIIVNETLGVVHYNQAALWRDDKIKAVSGVARPESAAPYNLWLSQVLKSLSVSANAKEFHQITSADFSKNIAEEWTEWFPAFGLWCPIILPNGTLAGGLFLGRNEEWQDGDKQLLDILLSAFSQSLMIQEMTTRKPIKHWSLKNRKQTIITAGIILLIAFLPLRVSVLAPAEIIATDSSPIRAPFDGVIANVAVKPNAPVHRGDKLLSFDLTELTARNEVANKALEMARSEYYATSQEAISDSQAKGKLATLASKIEQQQAELDYNKNLLGQADITSPIDGIAVFDDPAMLIGKPVTLGERVMLIAPSHDEMVEIQVPVADVVTFSQGAEVLFFSNIEPDHPQTASLNFASYASSMTEEGILCYKFRAKIVNNPKELRLGLKGIAKIYGERKPLILWLLRRPLAVIRQWLPF